MKMFNGVKFTPRPKIVRVLHVEGPESQETFHPISAGPDQPQRLVALIRNLEVSETAQAVMVFDLVQGIERTESWTSTASVAAGSDGYTLEDEPLAVDPTAAVNEEDPS